VLTAPLYKIKRAAVAAAAATNDVMRCDGLTLMTYRMTSPPPPLMPVGNVQSE